MSQIALLKLNKTWTKVETAIGEEFTFDVDKTYQFQFINGDGPAQFVEPSSIDSVTSDEGNRVFEGCTMQYKKGTNDLYAKASAVSCQVNVTVLGE